MNRTWRSSVVLRKARRYGAVPARIVCNAISRGDASRPPLVANSVPKSGTHLLIQVLQGLPGVRDWGLFLASTPSFRFRELPAARLARRIRALADGELAGAHLHHASETNEAMRARGAVHFFIYRDPRDVVVSEAYYLAHMNRWHRLHRHFRKLPDPQSRIRLAIEGLPAGSDLPYPPILERYNRYLAWLNESNTCAIRYEDLAGPGRENEVQRIVDHWITSTGSHDARGDLVAGALESITPEASHTYRRGAIGGWSAAMDSETLACFHRHAGDLLERLGYARDNP